MQTLQLQTAETHKKFLEAQAESSRTLQNMMENTQRLAEASIGLKVSTEVTKQDSLIFEKNISTPDFDLKNSDLPESSGHQKHIEEEPFINSLKEQNIIHNQTEIESEDKSQKNKIQQNKTSHSQDNIHEIENNLLDTVSHLTGYPMEMLGLDMDIESDLGIDSIKRVEIFSSLEEKLTDIQSVSPETMGSLKTLRQIAEFLAGTPLNNGPQTSTINTPINTIASLKIAAENELPEINISDISRRVVSIVEKPYKQGDRLDIPQGRKVFVTDDNSSLSKAIAEELKSQDIDAEHISGKMLMNKKNLPKAAGLIILPTNDFSAEEQKNGKILKDAFILTNHLASDLIDSAAKKGAIFATITRLDGAFGFKGKGIANAVTGGLAALAKTASIEWENVCCRAIDIAPDWKDDKERGRNNFLNYASQLQATFARSQITKISK